MDDEDPTRPLWQAPDPPGPVAPASAPPPPLPTPQWSPTPYPPIPPPPGAPQASRRVVGVRLLVVLSLVAGLLGAAIGAFVVAAFVDDDQGESVNRARRLATDAPPLPDDNTSVVAVADQLLPSVVQIKVTSGSESATGSGFVLDDAQHVVTNNHVVEMAAEEGEIRVVLRSGAERKATIVGRSPSYDLAVLEVRGTRLEPASIGRSADLRVGQPVVAIGSPLGLSSTVTSGIVSALDRPVTAGGAGESSYIRAIQTDAAINPGNSGGPLVDLSGKVIGVNSAIATLGSSSGQSGSIGVGFAIPIDQVRRTAKQILETGKAVYPVIGASVDVGTEDGAVITEIMPDSPADEAGLREEDVIVSIDGERVNNGVELIVAIRARVPGDAVKVGYVRAGEPATVRLTLDQQVG